MKSQNVILMLCLCTHVALGGIITTQSGSEQTDQIWTEQEEPRGAVISKDVVSIYSDWKIGFSYLASQSEERVLINLDRPGISYSSDRDNDPLLEKKSLWTAGDIPALLADPDTFFSETYARLKARPSTPAEKMFLSSIPPAPGGKADDLTAGDTFADPARYMQRVNTNGFSDLDFILSGAINIDWSGVTPSGEAPALYGSLTQIPEPASIAMVVLVSLTGLFIRRRFR